VTGDSSDYERCLQNMMEAKVEICANTLLPMRRSLNGRMLNDSLVQEEWAQLPAPKRGDIVRQMGNEYRAKLEVCNAMNPMCLCLDPELTQTIP
tara:strand:- start:1304 stop:1585 length:282 start_codon:yes stop_codon:yes gene_type:complete